MVIKVADFKIKYDGSYKFLKPIKRFWSTDDIVFDFEVFDDFEPNHNNWSDNYYEKQVSFHYSIANVLSLYESFLLHSATFDINGSGVAFSAQSGTGKTTHMLNWQNLLGDKLTIVNGDKPIVRFFDEGFCREHNLSIPENTEFGVPYAYGTPWMGKEALGCNMRTQLKHICFIERSETNFVTKIDKSEAVSRIMKQVYIPKDPVALSNTLNLVNRLISSCELWIIHCNMEPESAEVAYKAIFGE